MDCDKPMKATPAKDIRDHVMNVNIAKSEGEWWAKHRIDGLEGALARLCTHWDELLNNHDCGPEFEAREEARRLLENSES